MRLLYIYHAFFSIASLLQLEFIFRLNSNECLLFYISCRTSVLRMCCTDENMERQNNRIQDDLDTTEDQLESPGNNPDFFQLQFSSLYEYSRIICRGNSVCLCRPFIRMKAIIIVVPLFHMMSSKLQSLHEFDISLSKASRNITNILKNTFERTPTWKLSSVAMT